MSKFLNIISLRENPNPTTTTMCLFAFHLFFRFGVISEGSLIKHWHQPMRTRAPRSKEAKDKATRIRLGIYGVMFVFIEHLEPLIQT